ncbi:DUF4383 domain-containing protein [Effusibacillus pohliae]|uniref:DUF4383 domain-containing protein n=1 Tax=Effusibacillus pohliae TaxID=232270 RepID=UPI0003719B8F|nr:DUF4383 domain-containing protein [Effusibacillus pohliae]
MATTFARTAGWIFLILGILGFFVSHLAGLIQFDAVHNLLHLMLGVLALAAAANQKARLYAVVAGPLLLLLGIVGFFVSPLGGIHLEPLENMLHFALGGWGMWAGVYRTAE